MGTCQYERNVSTYMRAAAVAEEVFAKNPQHPGAIHYLIHAYDDPVHAPLGLRAARIYGKVAGSASHAQHMPSHIFFALGMWDDAIAANEASVRVADERIKRKGLTVKDRNYHSLLWLEYAYLQEGRVSDAKQVLSTIEMPNQLAHMRAVYAVETGDWDDLAKSQPSPKGELLTNLMVVNAGVLVELAHGRLDQARALSATAKTLLNDSAAAHTDAAQHSSMPMAEAPSTGKIMKIMVEQIDGAILYADGKPDRAFEILANATHEEDALSFEFGPPSPLKPSHELYGELLLKAGRAKEAELEFQKVLERTPGRNISVRGLAKAHDESGEQN